MHILIPEATTSMKKSILNRLIGLLVAILMAPTAFAAVSEQAEETKLKAFDFEYAA